MTKKHTFKDLHWIYQSMINWEKKSSEKKELIKLLDSESDTFSFLKGKIAKDDIHAYLGLYENQIYLHFLPSSIDKEESFKDSSVIPDQLSSCVAYNENKCDAIGSPIKPKDAVERIENWKNKELRDKAILSSETYQLFFIPNDNFEDNFPLKVNFALNNNTPDLIIEQIGNRNNFFDTCRPVPPFPPQTSENFALLNLIKEWSTK